MPGLIEQSAFDEYVGRYEAWYDSPKGRALFATEVACLRPMLARFLRPYLEIGVGSGRFAGALGIGYGVDPSHASLTLARRRGVQVVVGTGEALPFRDGQFGAVLIAFTLCFMNDPAQAISESRRLLTRRGGLVLGLLLRGTPWADYYAARGAEGHPIYRHAVFHSKAEVEAMLTRAGFRRMAYRSTLFQRPGLEAYVQEEEPADGYSSDAGFVCLTAVED
jgi:SAM-dependent methyltransferase